MRRERKMVKDIQSMSEHCTAFRVLRIESWRLYLINQPLINELISKSGTIQ